MPIRPNKSQSPSAVSVAAPQTKDFLIFTLGEQYYGIEAVRVKEIRAYTSITPLPNAPPYICGVLDLRGEVVPVADLRIRFGMTARPYDKFTVVVLASVGTRVVGLIVDTVWDLIAVSPDAIRPPPELARVDTSFILGMISHEQTIILLLKSQELLVHDLLGTT